MITLVTGASGHVGRNLVRALLARGERVRAFFHGPPTGLDGLPIERVRGDVRDRARLRAAMTDVRVVYHLAARISLEHTDPGLWRVNVDGVRNTAWAARQAGVRRFVHFSSVHAFRFPIDGTPVHEASARCVGAAHPAYDRTKAAGERALHEEIARGLPAVIVNPTGILGPHDHDSYLGRGLVQSFRGLGLAMPPGGFDWVDVRDVVTSAMAAADRGRVGENYILGGAWASMVELSGMAAEVAGHRQRPRLLPRRLGYGVAHVARLAARASSRPPLLTPVTLRTVEHAGPVDDRKARVELGHTARPLRASLVDLYRWYRETGRIRDDRLARVQRGLGLSRRGAFAG